MGSAKRNQGREADSLIRNLYLVIPGIPQTKLRPRFSRFKGKVRTYDSQAEEKDTFKWQLKARMRNEVIITEPIKINIMFYMPIPKSTAGKKRVLMLDGTVKHTKKPDLDNVLKFALDCMNNIVYDDDKQIYSATTAKYYAIEPRTEITLTWKEKNGK